MTPDDNDLSTPDADSAGKPAPSAGRAAAARPRRTRLRRIGQALVLLPALFLVYLLLLVPFTPGISDIRKQRQELPAQVLSADGKLLAEFKRANREWVALDRVSHHVIDALIATEDHRFYQHFGLDWRRTLSAAWHTVSGDVQGGSTLTQQLARNLFPEEIGRAQSINRKLKEAITALKIEAVYSKEEILETYLNTVPFLYNATGIEMAARTYFDKPAQRLDVLEAATLVGMLKGTSYYNPVLNPERAQQRRNLVLAQMARRGHLDADRLKALQRRALRVDFERQTPEEGPAPHFAVQLRKWLIAWADRNDYNVYSDGLVVRTTIDSRLQALANQAVQRQGQRLQGIADAAWSMRGGWSEHRALVEAFVRDTPQYRAARDAGQQDREALAQVMRDGEVMRALHEQKTRIQVGFLAMEPRTGAIRAWVGSRDFAEDAFDHVQQARRQPGSTFKPFVYGAAFARGIGPQETIRDEAVEIRLAGGEVWRPSDGAPPSGRELTLRDGLAWSKNTITAQLMQTVGPARVASLARAMGVRHSALDPVPSLALGTSPVTLKEMVTAYATIANAGAYLEPLMVTRIEDREGNVLASFAPAGPEQAMPADAAYTLLDVMRDVIDRGTGRGIRTRFGIRGDVAGKTGTTQDNADGWFILMHPQLVAGAWVGFNDARVTLRSDYWGQGAHSALPIVGDVVQRALRTRLIDGRARFENRHEPGMLDPFLKPIEGWISGWWGDRAASEPASAEPRADAATGEARSERTAPTDAPADAAADAAAPAPAEPAPEPSASAVPAATGAQGQPSAASAPAAVQPATPSAMPAAMSSAGPSAGAAPASPAPGVQPPQTIEDLIEEKADTAGPAPAPTPAPTPSAPVPAPPSAYPEASVAQP
ncbi:penicillin-binding protein 1A [Cupriavidus sp. AU9028]|uniref:penicillin-binding protein 1A n=1 Tax=Cupriavidus sp. AU9028 TaxID=2871157 RepID=UPI001C948C1B|nr:transglycosylase domain-containing protein [Cupriavidus sp. AU9028]MBY4898608.1 transglycosylase domain-containing protein [Cupriavidus sp. AU9028]